MGALDRLGELHRIADQHDVARARAGSDEVGQRHLSGLVDEQIVELLVVLVAGEQPRRAADQRQAAEAGIVIVLGDSNAGVSQGFAVVALLDLLDRLQLALSLARPLGDSKQQIVDGLMRMRGHGDAFA